MAIFVARGQNANPDLNPPHKLEKWTTYLGWAKEGKWDAFGSIDGAVFQREFFADAEKEAFKDNSDFLFVCGSGLANWAVRQTSLTEEQKYSKCELAIPLVRRAAELGNWRAMEELAWMKSEGLGAAKDSETAIRWAQLATNGARREFGAAHERYGDSLVKVANLHLNCRTYRQATQFFHKELQYQSVLNDKAKRNTMLILAYLGILHSRTGELSTATKLLRKVADMSGEILGEQHLEHAVALENLAMLYFQTGKYSRARTLSVKVLQIRKAAMGPNNPEYARSLNDIANTDAFLRHFESAEAGFQKALGIMKVVAGDRSPGYVNSALNLAECYRNWGKLEAAKSWILKAQHLMEGAMKTGALPGLCLNTLGLIQTAEGQFYVAEQSFRKALKIFEATGYAESAYYGICLNNLAESYRITGHKEAAEQMFGRALESIGKHAGKSHPIYAKCLNNLGLLKAARKDYESAASLFESALATTKNSVGEQHPDFGLWLNNLAECYRSLGETDTAEHWFKIALGITTNSVGRMHPNSSYILNNLGLLHVSKGNFDAAQALFQDAFNVTTNSFGQWHPQCALWLNNLAVLSIQAGERTRAFDLAVQASSLSRQYQDSLFDELGDSRQMALQKLEFGKANIVLAAGILLDSAGPQAYNHWLAWKGAVTKRQRWRREQLGSDKASELWAELRKARSDLASALISIPSESKKTFDPRLRIQRLRRRMERVEEDLARMSTRFSAERELVHTTLESVCQALPADSVLLDFASYSRLLRSKSNTLEWEQRMTVFVVRRGHPLQWIDLGPTENLKDLEKQWREAINPRKGSYSAELKTGTELRKRLWDPVAAWIRGAGEIRVSPAGIVTRIPMGALPTEAGEYLGERHSFITVPAVQLMGTARSRDGNSDRLLAVGGVDYDSAPGSNRLLAATGLRNVNKRADGLHDFKPLQNTRAELLSAKRVFEHSRQNGVVRSLQGPSATEAEVVSQMQGSRWVHLATHGYFDTNRSMPVGVRNGLALAGANHRDWEPGKDDGILTAEEVGALNLTGTDLVVLSACETGLGVNRAGEGVLGLQRAFQVAGARSVVASLWPVSDRWTLKFMERFYEELWQRGKSKADALRAAQLHIMATAPKRGRSTEPRRTKASPYFWAAFALSGEAD